MQLQYKQCSREKSYLRKHGMPLHIKPCLTLAGCGAKLAAFIFTEHARPATLLKLLSTHTTTNRTPFSLSLVRVYRSISQQRPESHTSVISGVILIPSAATPRPNSTNTMRQTQTAYTCLAPDA